MPTKIIKIGGAIAIGIAAVVGIVFIVYGYLNSLMKPYYDLKKGSEISGDALAYGEDL